jgi:hypothetical protein
VRLELAVHERVRLSLGPALRVEFADKVVLQGPPAPVTEADLILWRLPVEACAQVYLLRDAVDLYLELGGAFELMFLTAGKIHTGVGPQPLSFERGRVFGYGPGGVAALGLRWSIGRSLTMHASAAYRLSRLFFSEELLVPGTDQDPLSIPPRNLLHGVELSVGLALGL